MPATENPHKEELINTRRYVLSAVSDLEKASGFTPVVQALKQLMKRLHDVAEELS